MREKRRTKKGVGGGCGEGWEGGREGRRKGEAYVDVLGEDGLVDEVEREGFK